MANTTVSKEEQWKTVTDGFVEMCKENNCTTQKSVKKVIKNYLMSKYKNKAPKEYLSGLADDFTESVCIQMNIPQF